MIARAALLGGVAAAMLGHQAAAQAAPGETELRPLLDSRVRYEHVDQEDFHQNADAVTARTRLGAELAVGNWSLLAESEGTLALSGRYDNGLNGRTRFPLVADPETIEINRLQLRYSGLPRTTFTAGRQRINLDDQRFVGSVGWRDNEQTFDAVRVEYGSAEELKADLTYSWSVRTIWGIDGEGPRQQAIGGNNLFVTLDYATPYGTLGGFTYLVDLDEAAIAGFGLSSQTYGVHFAGSRAVSRDVKLSYAASYAHQADYHRNPQDYAADRYWAEGAVEIGALRLGLGHDVLGADDGRALTSFQTPLATLHKFQGWTDKFLVTPPDGVRDLYANAGYAWRDVAGLDSVEASVTWHRFRSDRLGLDYGQEWDAMVSARRASWRATAKVARYDARRYATDTAKFWLQLEWSY